MKWRAREEREREGGKRAKQVQLSPEGQMARKTEGDGRDGTDGTQAQAGRPAHPVANCTFFLPFSGTFTREGTKGGKAAAGRTEEQAG